MQKIHLKREPNLDARLQAFSYQAEAVKAIRDLDYSAVFHEQGLGKTKIALDLILYWLEVNAVDTVLLVVKKGLIANWLREIKTHTYLSVRVISQDRRANYFVFNSPARLMLTHFESVVAEKARFKLFFKARSVGVILDESAKIKNPETSLAQTFHELAPLIKKRVIMTGTPVANRPYDIWSQVWFLDQGKSLGNDFESFKKNLDLTNDLNEDELKQKQLEYELSIIEGKLAGFCVRETKASGIISLPEKIIQRVSAVWETRQFELYRQVRDELRGIVIKEGLPREDNTEPILKRLLRLVQIASNPKLVDDSYNGIPGKFDYLLDIIEHATQKKEKLIIWSSFTANVEWLARELQAYGVCCVHGKMKMADRNRAVERFLTDEELRIFVATPGAAKEGLTLTVANHVIFYDRTFSLDDYLQAQDRIHRISQKKTCYVHNIIMEESIDEWVDILLHSKQLAAQFAQGDISSDYYQSQMSYKFGDVLARVLDLEKTQKGK